jgi:hypothetical protein
MNALTVCVNYHDYLALTLPLNRRHFRRFLVVTSPEDNQTAHLAAQWNCDLHVTDAFTRGGADFNKWLALEEGLDVLGRQGVLCLLDADTVLPPELRVEHHSHGVTLNETAVLRGMLLTPLRHMMLDATKPIPPYNEWDQYKLHGNQGEWAGYCQIFHADDPVLGDPPWHETNWRHAGGADSLFQRKWPRDRKIRPHWKVLHLGPAGTNWCGRRSPYLEGGTPEQAAERRQQMELYMRQRRRALGQDPFAAEKL